MARSELPKSRFDAVILLGHGSRVPGADRSMLLLADDLRRTGLYPQVETCNMSRLGPTFKETLSLCVRSGAKEILLMPYFLNEGLHMKLDIPSMMRKAAKEHPNIRLYFGKNLGYDELLFELVKKRIREAEFLGDVRELELAGEEEYPLGQGELEFVPMLPEEAAKWKGRNTSHDLGSNTKKEEKNDQADTKF
ncbi:MAG: CbiX/SirB N-terminal domain-containing protein [Actinomycetota bacterium]|nr:CbiX/SirB N-terminal domain-containing protein [Actinomycetota bacterium]